MKILRKKFPVDNISSCSFSMICSSFCPPALKAAQKNKVQQMWPKYLSQNIQHSFIFIVCVLLGAGKPFVCILCISISQPNPAGHILHITNISLSAIWLTTQSNVGSSIQIHLLFLCANKLPHSFPTLVDGNCSGRSVFWETYVGSPLKSLKMFAQL